MNRIEKSIKHPTVYTIRVNTSCTRRFVSAFSLEYRSNSVHFFFQIRKKYVFGVWSSFMSATPRLNKIEAFKKYLIFDVLLEHRSQVKIKTQSSDER